MAYGFRCTYCGHQSSAHEISEGRVDNPAKRIRGFRYSLNSCPGFTYQRAEEADAIECYRHDRIPDFPERLKKRADLLDEKKNKGSPINHAVWAIIGNRVVDIGS